MKSTNNLKAAEIILNGETIETAEVHNLCQMWKAVKKAIADHGHAVRVLVTDNADAPFMDITVKELANGKFNMVNSIKETRRSQIVLAHRAAEKAKAAEKAEQEKLEAKKAKKAAADKARREKKKAEKAAAAEQTEA